jgi:TRAP-type mannitol/chloroaromatic compound transport system permease small subunit
MKSDYVLIGSVLLLAIGLGLIFRYTHGNVGFSFSVVPASAASVQVSINTTGLPAMAGIPLTLLGLVLLIAAVISAIVRALPIGRQPALPQRMMKERRASED